MPKATWDNLPEDKRARVMGAALAEFARHGFSAGSLNVIAREAGVAKGSLFQYFDDKLDLFATACDACSGRVRDHMTDVLERRGAGELPFWTLVRTVVLDWIAYFRDHPQDRGLTFASTFEIDPEVRGTVRRVTNRHYTEVLTPLIKLAADRGELRDDADQATLLAYLLLLLPHLALAPFGPELDAALGLYGKDLDDLHDPVNGLIDALERAFGPSASPAA